MKFVAISDTHGQHRSLNLPMGDILLHTGDVSEHGEKEEILDFIEWMDTLDFEFKIFIGGNHDAFLEKYSERIPKLLPDDVFYLENEGIEINNTMIWGSPAVPDLYGFPFGKERGFQMEENWKYMPFDTQILMTHTPPRGILDKNRSDRSNGCRALLQKVREVMPVYHVFGHAHASYGQIELDGTTFINAAALNSYTGLMNEAVTFNF